MALSYRIDALNRCVLIEMTGYVTAEEVNATLERMWADPAHDPAYARLVDASELTGTSANSTEIRALANRYGSRVAGRTALVARKNAVFGLLRMYELYADDPNCQVFRSRFEALEWVRGTV